MFPGARIAGVSPQGGQGCKIDFGKAVDIRMNGQTEQSSPTLIDKVSIHDIFGFGFREVAL